MAASLGSGADRVNVRCGFLPGISLHDPRGAARYFLDGLPGAFYFDTAPFLAYT